MARPARRAGARARDGGGGRPPTRRGIDDDLRTIAEEYKRRFRQDAESWMTVPVRMVFYYRSVTMNRRPTEHHPLYGEIPLI